MNERRATEELLLGPNSKKKFVRYREGAKLYSLGQHTFERIAKEAGAVYRIGRIRLVNTEILDEYMESFREESIPAFYY